MTINYILFQSSLPAAFHHYTPEELSWLRDDMPHHEVPTVILSDPAVGRAVKTMLGPNAEIDECRHVHINTEAEDGDWHRDDYDGDVWPLGYDFAILFYFPQDLPLEMGGTAILAEGHEIIATGPAGMCLLARSDVVHRARANTTGKTRYMMKYLFRAEKQEITVPYNPNAHGPRRIRGR